MTTTKTASAVRNRASERKFRLVMMFHPSHRVPDLGEAEEWFQRVFGVPSQRLETLIGSSGDPLNRNDYSTFTTIRDLVFDTIDPKRLVKDGVQRYPSVERPHLNGFGWYVDGIAEAYRELRSHGYVIVDRHGEPFTGDEPPTADGGQLPMYWLTPEDAGLRYQFLPLIPFPGDPRVVDGWKLSPVSDADPLGIVRCSHHTVLTDRPERAVQLFTGVLGAEVIHEGRNETIGATSTYVQVADGIYEFAVPDQHTAAYADWQSGAPSDTYHAISFQVTDLAKAVDHLEAQGVSLRTRSKNAVVTDPQTSLGIPWGFVTDLIPGDPRRT